MGRLTWPIRATSQRIGDDGGVAVLIIAVGGRVLVFVGLGQQLTTRPIAIFNRPGQRVGDGQGIGMAVVGRTEQVGGNDKTSGMR